MNVWRSVYSSELLSDNKNVLQLTEDELKILKKVSKMFESTNETIMISLVKHDNAFKIISSCIPNNTDKSSLSFQKLFCVGYLDDYIQYLDYLYLRGIDVARELLISLSTFEMLIKTIVCCYDVHIQSFTSNIVKVANKENDNMIFYNIDTMRPTFNENFLRKVREDIQNRFQDARNKPNIEEVAKLLVNRPRPTLEIITE